MPAYRLYIFDKRERMSRVATLDCVDDEAAVKAAQAQRSPQRMELWRGGRLVRAFPPQS